MATRATFVWEMTASVTIPEDHLSEDQIIERYGGRIDVQEGSYVEDSFSAPLTLPLGAGEASPGDLVAEISPAGQDVRNARDGNSVHRSPHCRSS